MQITDDIRATIHKAEHDGHAIRLTVNGDTFVGRTYGIRMHPDGPVLSYLDVDSYNAGEIPLEHITAVENLGRPLADVLDERLMRRVRQDGEWAHVELSPELLQRIDATRGTTPRERWIMQAIETRLYRDARGW